MKGRVRFYEEVGSKLAASHFQLLFRDFEFGSSDELSEH